MPAPLQSLLCVTQCEKNEFLKIIMLFLKKLPDNSELIFVDSGAASRQDFFASLRLDASMAARIHYFHAPQCATPEEKVALIAQHAKGKLWHFITPDAHYPEGYFQQRAALKPHEIYGSTLKPFYIPAMHCLRSVTSRASHFSYLGMLSFHRQHYDENGIWFNTQGDQASVGKGFTECGVENCPIAVENDLTALCNSGTLSDSKHLPFTRHAASFVPPVTRVKVDWSLIDKIVYINLASRPDREAKLLAELKNLHAPLEKIVRFNAIAAKTGTEGCTLSHIAVLEMARENNWSNVLVLEDDICFVRDDTALQRLNHFLTLLSGIDWDVAMLSANYKDVAPLTTHQNIVKVKTAFTTGSYLVNQHYYPTLSDNFKQGLAQLRSSEDPVENALDKFWHHLMLNDRWLGCWPCVGYQSQGYSDIEKAERDYIPLFFSPLSGLMLAENQQTEQEHLPRFYSSAAGTADYQALETLYRAKGCRELADYFFHQQHPQRDVPPQNPRWPLLSVIIPTYNQANVLMQTLDSVLRQRYPHMEVVVMDDCSTDDTPLRLASINDARLKVVRNKTNLQGAENLYQGFHQHTRGDYTFIIDHDDVLLDRDYLMEAVMRLEQDKSLAFVFASNLNMFHEHNQIGFSGRYAKCTKINGKDYFKNYLLPGYSNVLYLTAVFRRSMVIKLNAFVREGFADTFMFMRLMLAGNVGFIPRMPSLYRVHASSITHNLNNVTDFTHDKNFVRDLEQTLDLACKNGLPRPLMKQWFIRICTAHFLHWRLPHILRNQGVELVSAIADWLCQYYPDVGEPVLAALREFEE